MEDETAPITIKVEIEEDIPEDQSIVTTQTGISEEHNYTKIMEEDLYYRLQLHHSIDIKEEIQEVETENSSSDEITIQQQIEAENQTDELIKNNVNTNQDPTEFSSQRQKIKTENLDVDIKVEDDLMEVDNNMQEECNLITDNPSSVKSFHQNYQATNGNLKRNKQGEEYLTLADFGEVKVQRMPSPSGGKFLKEFIAIGCLMATAKKKTDQEIERRREVKKLSMRRAREKLKNDPVKYEEQKKKEREQKRRSRCRVRDLSERQQRRIRKEWRERSKRYRVRKRVERE